MKQYAVNKQIYLQNKHFFDSLLVKDFRSKITSDDIIIGWGRKKSGHKASRIAKEKNCKKLLCEDGFYRSAKLGSEGHLSISIIKDNVGIYYDATEPSQLENYLNNDSCFENLNVEKMRNHISYIKHKQLSKYNFNLKVPDTLFPKKKKRLLFVAQTKGDMSLRYGFGDDNNSIDIIVDALKYYPADEYDYYVKVHPEALLGTKESDIEIDIFQNYGFQILSENYNPIDLLSYFDVVYTKTSQMGFEALLLDKEVVCFGAPFYSGWGLTQDRVFIDRRVKKRTIEELFYASVILYPEYCDPFNGNKLLFEDALQLLSYHKNIFEMDSETPHLYGFSLWKRNYVAFFIKNKNLVFHNYRPSKKQLKKNNNFVWGMKKIRNIPSSVGDGTVIRVEDGFIRSVKLGSDLTMPYSLIFDKTGIYFNAEGPSDLENLLNSDLNFNDSLRGKGEKLIKILRRDGISKYNNYALKPISFDTDKKNILVIGQVDNDASLVYNMNKDINNLKLLETVCDENPDAYIIFKPHPDVISGNRKSSLSLEEANRLADEVVIDNHIDSVIKAVDEVHVMTSLSGLEALIRNKKVVCHGTPFYSGWGLTEDKYKIDRRSATRTLEELVAATYILYPRYIDPVSKRITDVFFTIDLIKNEMSSSFIKQPTIRVPLFKKIVLKIIKMFKK